MLGGRIAKKGTVIESSYQMASYQDIWEEERAIKYDGELTPEVCMAIEAAWNQYNDSLPMLSSSGRPLRWREPERFVRVDVERRAVIVRCTTNLAD